MQRFPSLAKNCKLRFQRAFGRVWEAFPLSDWIPFRRYECHGMSFIPFDENLLKRTKKKKKKEASTALGVSMVIKQQLSLLEVTPSYIADAQQFSR